MDTTQIFAYIAILVLVFNKDFQRKWRESTRETGQPLMLFGLMLFGLGVIGQSGNTSTMGVSAIILGALVLGTTRR